MKFTNLSKWLQWQENLHFTEVDLGLERISRVWKQLGGTGKFPFTIITVAGTNGKGSSVSMLESILRASGYRTGVYTSPHLLRYNERIRINCKPCNDKEICQSFERIDGARNDSSLTYFEFATLAAMDIFCRNHPDIVILEVGMGGRLDAVNLFDADIALITSISLDHTMWLGNDRENIAMEKAGIIRSNKSVVFSEQLPATSILEYSKSLDAICYIAEKDFFAEENDKSWNWYNTHIDWPLLPLPSLLGSYQVQNAAAVLQVIILLNQLGLCIHVSSIKVGLRNIELLGRFQVIIGDVERIFDVTHNHQGACNLARLLMERKTKGRTYAVLSMLKDKDINAVIEPLKGVIDYWLVASLNCSRSMNNTIIADKIRAIVGGNDIVAYKSVVEAYKEAMIQAKYNDRVLIFGSFYTVEAVMKLIF
ncbi:MAG: bifunctional tetrahydrofolate synthase/dihydrofolate synthase [Piscirickettsiaceae bacterium]|nr:bifunctional tetrahydrofolate synthase/dihydrofolate synthase [Piscirickettsiaceae bacterium]